MKDAILALVRAAFWGSLAGGGPFMLLTVPLAISAAFGSELGWGLWLAFMPVAIAGAVVVPASICLGLPLTALFTRYGRDDRNSYTAAGLLLGAALPTGFSLLSDIGVFGMILAVPGAIAGTVTAVSWGRWREEVAGGINRPAKIFE